MLHSDATVRQGAGPGSFSESLLLSSCLLYVLISFSRVAGLLWVSLLSGPGTLLLFEEEEGGEVDGGARKE